MRRTSGRTRWATPLAAGTLVLGLIGQIFIGASPVAAQQAGEPVELRGFATGQPGHVGALTSGGTTVGDAEVAWSGAAVDADGDGLKGSQLNEVNRIFQPDRTNKLSYARGSGLEIGLATTPADENQVILSAKAEADAPPSSSDVQEVGVEGLDPIAYASALRGEAVANANESGLVPDVCVLGDDLARGRAHAADVELVDAGGDTAAPQLDAPLISLNDEDASGEQRNVSQSTSREKLVPSGLPNNFGLMSEVRQTIAPVTLVQNRVAPASPRLITIEALGEWVLRVVANGRDGGASVFYGPGEVDPQTPVLSIIDSDNAATRLLSTQDLFGDEGLVIPIEGVAEIAVGEDPRAIAAPGTNPDAESKPKIAADGTSVSAAADVVRISLLSQPDPQLADIRIGHMEASAEVPRGGVDCPIPVDKSATDVEISVGDETTISITVDNPYDCDLEEVILVDTISQLEGSPRFKITGTGGAAEPTSDDDLTAELPPGEASQTVLQWDLGTIEKGKSKSVNFTIEATAGGKLRDIAEATGTFANCSGSDATGLAIAGLDLSGLSVPVDVGIATPQTGATAGRTAAMGAGLAILAVGVGLFLRRRSARSA